MLYEFTVPYVAYGSNVYVVRAESKDEAWDKFSRRDFCDIISRDPTEGVMDFVNAQLDGYEDEEDDWITRCSDCKSMYEDGYGQWTCVKRNTLCKYISKCREEW